MIQLARPSLTSEDVVVVPDEFEEDMDELIVLVINSLAALGGMAMPSFRDALGPASIKYDSPASPNPDYEDICSVESLTSP